MYLLVLNQRFTVGAVALKFNSTLKANFLIPQSETMLLEASRCKKAAAQRATAGKLAKKSTTDTPVTSSSGDTNTTEMDN
jgi:hypothetical protein